MGRPKRIVKDYLRYILPQYKIPHNGKWFIYSELELIELSKTNKEEYNRIDKMIYEYQINPIAHFLPHGVIQEGQTLNDGQRLLNDYDHDLLLLQAGNQQGKSIAMSAFFVLRLIPTDPNWEIYKNHGIKYKEWAGPNILIAASYSWDNTRVLYDTYRQLLPRDELGVYSPYYGQFKGEDDKSKNLTFGVNSRTEIELKCGSKIVFLCHGTQKIEHFEGRTAKYIHLDEQPPENIFSACTSRQITLGNYTPIGMSLTPHCLAGRPDTGSSGWIKTRLIDANETQGRRFAIYRLSMDTVPDAIIAPEQKKRSYEQWIIEPTKNNNIRKINEGRSRYYGEFEVGGGLVFSEFNPDIHLIEEFDVKIHSPMWCRMIDHGQNPCAALLFAILPWGDIVVTNEYYAYDRSIAENARGIVEEMCSNDIHIVDSYSEGDQRINVYQERFSNKIIQVSELDSRSYGTKDLNGKRNLGNIYSECGLAVRPACGQHDKILIPLAKDMFTLDKNREHINKRLGRIVSEAQSKYGAPKLYIFNTCKHLITELKQYAEKPGKEGIYTVKLTGKDHLLSCIKFFSGRNRTYQGEGLEFYNNED